MAHGDRVIVIDAASPWYGRQGEIGTFTVQGGVGIKIGGRVEVFGAHQLELAELVRSLPADGTSAA